MKRKSRLLISILLVLSICLSVPAAAFASSEPPLVVKSIVDNSIIFKANSPYVYAYGKPELVDPNNLSVTPVLLDFRSGFSDETLFIPFDAISRYFESVLSQNRKTYTVDYKGRITTFEVDSKSITVDGQSYNISAGAIDKGGRIYISENLLGYIFTPKHSNLSEQGLLVIAPKESTADISNNTRIINASLEQTISDLFDTFPTRNILDNSLTLSIGNSKAILNGSVMQVDEKDKTIAPIIVKGRTLVPLRFISQSMGAAVSWDQPTKTAFVELNGNKISIKIGSTSMLVNGKSILLDSPAILYNSKTFVPLRAIAEALKKQVFFDNGVIIIGDKSNPIDYSIPADVKTKLVKSIVFFAFTNKAMVNGVYTDIDKNDPYVMPRDVSFPVTSIPVKFTVESLGGKYAVEYKGQDNELTGARKIPIITITLNGVTARMEAGKNAITVNGKQVWIDRAAYEYYGAVYIDHNLMQKLFNKKIYNKNGILVISDTDIATTAFESRLVSTLKQSLWQKLTIDNIKIQLDTLRRADANSVNGNSPNNSTAIKQGDWIYFSKPQYGGLWKMKLDGTGKVMLAAGEARNINVVDDHVYYTGVGNIWKIKIDGTGLTKVNQYRQPGEAFEHLFYVDNWLYHWDSDDTMSIARMRTNGSTDYDNRSFDLWGATYDLLIAGQYAYYTNSYDNFSLYRFDMQRGIVAKLNNVTSNDINIMDGYLYFSNENDGNKLYRIKDDFDYINQNENYTIANTLYTVASQPENISVDSGYIANAYDGWIYYNNQSDGGKLYRIRTDGTQRTKLLNTSASGLSIIGDIMIYTTSTGTYKAKTNGTQVIKL